MSSLALIEKYRASITLNVFPEKSQILSCDSVVENERYVTFHVSTARKATIPTILIYLQYIDTCFRFFMNRPQTVLIPKPCSRYPVSPVGVEKQYITGAH